MTKAELTEDWIYGWAQKEISVFSNSISTFPKKFRECTIQEMMKYHQFLELLCADQFQQAAEYYALYDWWELMPAKVDNYLFKLEYPNG